MDKAVFVIFIASCIIYSLIFYGSHALESVWVCNILNQGDKKRGGVSFISRLRGMCTMKRTNFIINLLLFIGLWTLLSTQTKNNNLKTLLLFMILFQLITLNLSTYMLFSPLLGPDHPSQARVNQLLYAVFMLAANSGILVNLLM